MNSITIISKSRKYGGSTASEAIHIGLDALLTATTQTELPVKLSTISKLIGINPLPIYRNQESIWMVFRWGLFYRLTKGLKP